MLRDLAIVALALPLMSLAIDARQGRGLGNPHVPSEPAPFDSSAIVRLDDMLLDRQGLAIRTDVAQGFPGFTVYYSQPWDFGVVPIQFPADLPVERRDAFWRACRTWGERAPVLCVPRTSESQYIEVTTTEAGCFSYVGQGFGGGRRQLNLADGCWGLPTILHELGHAFGFAHEHQRPDRDDFITIDLSNVREPFRFAFERLMVPLSLGEYDFTSIMHYGPTAFAIDPKRPTISPQPAFVARAQDMGRATLPSAHDHATLAEGYSRLLEPSVAPLPLDSVRSRFDRTDFLSAMERLHAFYFSRLGLGRSHGLSIGGRPDFLGLATWIFDIYLGARSAGFDTKAAFQIVVAALTRTQEWREHHPDRPSLPPTRPYRPYVTFDRAEFLGVLQKLDLYYTSPEGLQRPSGLSIGGGPDFLGIATWVFDVYLNARLTGASPNAAWTLVVNAIQATDEWRQKH